MKATQPSEFLKDCMADAVMRLLEKYPLNEIQIKQICEAMKKTIMFAELLLGIACGVQAQDLIELNTN